MGSYQQEASSAPLSFEYDAGGRDIVPRGSMRAGEQYTGYRGLTRSEHCKPLTTNITTYTYQIAGLRRNTHLCTPSRCASDLALEN